jgi:hypothetical protein
MLELAALQQNQAQKIIHIEIARSYPQDRAVFLLGIGKIAKLVKG